VEANIHAFRVGRLVVADPTWVQTLEAERRDEITVAPKLTQEARALVEAVGATGALKRLLEIRVPELIAYQDLAYAQAYVAFVKRVAETERAVMPGQTRLSIGVARYLFKLMAYKDEYEVARLHLKPELAQSLAEQFGRGAQLTYHLHPPFLRYLGLKQKIKLGKWFDLVYRLLVAMRRLRGTPFDLFGYTPVRRLERALIGEYRALIEEALTNLSPGTYEQAVKLANLPDMIRGYEEVKVRNVERFREEVRKVVEAFLIAT
jgi:indolepyruvate ferredoxin oxidoreductase